jgi:hypothetical protein
MFVFCNSFLFSSVSTAVVLAVSGSTCTTKSIKQLSTSENSSRQQCESLRNEEQKKSTTDAHRNGFNFALAKL